ncbi:MAG: ankyrin repeat domain-containing protein [Betaproteobacteria bacterium]|nr:ankyrin repeat domain-containing protein [Betaproteobacteria bacterium]
MACAGAALPDPVRFAAVIEIGDIPSARAWLDEGLDPDFEATRVGTGLMIGAWEGNIAMMELFHSRGADVNRTNRIGEQALQLATWKGHVEAVKWLLARGAVVNREGRQWGALHYAVFAGHRDIARLLIDHGADINARVPNESTALMLAAREGHEELAHMLVGLGADATAVNDWGDSALSWAMRYGHLRIARLVTPPEGFARAVQAPPQSFGTPSRSQPAGPQMEDILRRIRIAEAQGRPVDDLRRELFEAVADFRKGSTSIAVTAPARGKRAPPKALVITARRQQAGRERAELVYDGTAAPPQGAQGPLPTEVPEIVRQIRQA